MNFVCEKTLLNEAVIAAQRGAAVKSSFPALEGLLLTAKDGKLKITGYDLDLGIECTIEAEIGEQGAIVLNSRIFGEIIRKLPDDIISVSNDNKMITNIKCGISEFNIIGISADEFPELPNVTREKTIKIPQNILKSMIRQTLFAVSASDNKPVHTGALITIDGKTIKIAAVDGFRLALREETLEESYENISFVVPGKTLSEILKILKDNDSLVYIGLAKKHIVFEIDNVVLISRLLEGEFLNYKNVIPKEANITAVVNVRQFLDCIERAALLINEKIKSPIRCSFEYEIIKISSRTAIGTVYDELFAAIKGDNIEVGFNNRYMEEALKACETEKVKIEMNTSLSPIVLKPIEGNKFTFLVLPVRLKNDD